MSKLAFFFVTLIAAIPAGFLGYLAVMGFLTHSEAMPGILMGVTGITLLMCAAVVVMPIAVLMRRSPRPAEDEPEADAEPDVDAESIEEPPSETEFGGHEDAVVDEEFTEEEDSEIYAADEDEDLDFDAFEEDENQKR